MIKLSAEIGDYLRDDGSEDWEEYFLAACSEKVEDLLKILRILEGPQLLVDEDDMLASAESFCRNCYSACEVIPDDTSITSTGSALVFRHAWAGEGDIHYSTYEIEYIKILDDAEWTEKQFESALSACSSKDILKAIRFEEIIL